jgi:uncharacterized protein
VKNSPRKIVVDTSAFVSLLSSKDTAHQQCRKVLASLSELTSVFTTESCLVETSYLLPANRKLREKLHDLVKLLRITIVPMDSQSLDRILELQNRYADLPMDFADATLLVACETLDIRDIFTLDHKDFSIYKPNHCSRLTIHPHK